MSGPIYSVWDHLNGEEEDASRIEASSPIAAAVRFAEGDIAGLYDGCYDGGHEIAVRPEAGEVVIVTVTVEAIPHFHGTLAKP